MNPKADFAIVTVRIPVGPFWMGSSTDDPEAHENEKPRRELSLPEYRISRYPITNAQFAEFVRATGHPPPEHWDQGRVPIDLQDHPVVNVDYGDAAAFCLWLQGVTGKPYRLPTEEEWEKAARGGMPETRRYPWGGEWRLGVCNTQELEKNGTTPVQEFARDNLSPFEVVDMAGNVWEWTASSYAPYPGSSHQSPHFESAWVVRGGSWKNSRLRARLSCRGRYPPDARRIYLGFRVALDAYGETEGAIPIQESSLSVEPAQLRRNLIKHFSEDELRDLCFDLGVDYDILPGLGKGNKARELMTYLERRGRTSELVEECRRQRPNESW
jgi:formylglycine-generating enzyme required for sulfatase activity